MLLIAAVLCVSTLAVEVTGHKYLTESCPSSSAVENFDESRLLGTWKVEYAVKTTSSCMTMDFRREGSVLKVYERKELSPAEKVGLEIKYGSVGTLAKTATPGYYQASFSTSTITGRFVIMDTDYETYLVIFHCMQIFPFGSRRTVYVLSKGDNPITEEILSQVRTRLTEVQLKPELLARISHDNCVNAADADIDLTGSVNVKDVLKATKKVIEGAGTFTQLVQVLSMLGKK